MVYYIRGPDGKRYGPFEDGTSFDANVQRIRQQSGENVNTNTAQDIGSGIAASVGLAEAGIGGNLRTARSATAREGAKAEAAVRGAQKRGGGVLETARGIAPLLGEYFGNAVGAFNPVLRPLATGAADLSRQLQEKPTQQDYEAARRGAEGIFRGPLAPEPYIQRGRAKEEREKSHYSPGAVEAAEAGANARWDRPSTYGDFLRAAPQMAAESAAPTAAGMAVGIATRRPSLAMTTEGVQAAGAADTQIRDSIMAVAENDPQEFANSPAGRRYLRMFNGDYWKAAEAAADEGAVRLAPAVGISTALLARIGGQEKMYAAGGQLRGSLIRAFLHGGAGEGAEEFAQSAMEQLLGNVAREQAYTEPFSSAPRVLERVPEAGIQGALAGAIMGAPTTAAGQTFVNINQDRKDRRRAALREEVARNGIAATNIPEDQRDVPYEVLRDITEVPAPFGQGISTPQDVLVQPRDLSYEFPSPEQSGEETAGPEEAGVPPAPEAATRIPDDIQGGIASTPDAAVDDSDRIALEGAAQEEFHMIQNGDEEGAAQNFLQMFGLDPNGPDAQYGVYRKEAPEIPEGGKREITIAPMYWGDLVDPQEVEAYTRNQLEAVTAMYAQQGRDISSSPYFRAVSSVLDNPDYVGVISESSGQHLPPLYATATRENDEPIAYGLRYSDTMPDGSLRTTYVDVGADTEAEAKAELDKIVGGAPTQTRQATPEEKPEPVVAPQKPQPKPVAKPAVKQEVKKAIDELGMRAGEIVKQVQKHNTSVGMSIAKKAKVPTLTQAQEIAQLEKKGIPTANAYEQVIGGEKFNPFGAAEERPLPQEDEPAAPVEEEKSKAAVEKPAATSRTALDIRTMNARARESGKTARDIINRAAELQGIKLPDDFFPPAGQTMSAVALAKKIRAAKIKRVSLENALEEAEGKPKSEWTKEKEKPAKQKPAEYDAVAARLKKAGAKVGDFMAALQEAGYDAGAYKSKARGGKEITRYKKSMQDAINEAGAERIEAALKKIEGEKAAKAPETEEERYKSGPKFKAVSTEAVLSIVTGVLFTEFHNVVSVLEYMTGEELVTHQASRATREAANVILRNHPELESIAKEFKSRVNRNNYKELVKELHERIGETITVPRMGKNDWESIDPDAELAGTVSPEKIVSLGEPPKVTPDSSVQMREDNTPTVRKPVTVETKPASRRREDNVARERARAAELAERGALEDLVDDDERILTRAQLEKIHRRHIGPVGPEATATDIWNNLRARTAQKPEPKAEPKAKEAAKPTRPMSPFERLRSGKSLGGVIENGEVEIFMGTQTHGAQETSAIYKRIRDGNVELTGDGGRSILIRVTPNVTPENAKVALKVFTDWAKDARRMEDVNDPEVAVYTNGETEPRILIGADAAQFLRSRTSSVAWITEEAPKKKEARKPRTAMELGKMLKSLIGAADLPGNVYEDLITTIVSDIPTEDIESLQEIVSDKGNSEDTRAAAKDVLAAAKRAQEGSPPKKSDQNKPASPETKKKPDLIVIQRAVRLAREAPDLESGLTQARALAEMEKFSPERTALLLSEVERLWRKNNPDVVGAIDVVPNGAARLELSVTERDYEALNAVLNSVIERIGLKGEITPFLNYGVGENGSLASYAPSTRILTVSILGAQSRAKTRSDVDPTVDFEETLSNLASLAAHELWHALFRLRVIDVQTLDDVINYVTTVNLTKEQLRAFGRDEDAKITWLELIESNPGYSSGSYERWTGGALDRDFINRLRKEEAVAHFLEAEFKRIYDEEQRLEQLPFVRRIIEKFSKFLTEVAIGLKNHFEAQGLSPWAQEKRLSALADRFARDFASGRLAKRLKKNNAAFGRNIMLLQAAERGYRGNDIGEAAEWVSLWNKAYESFVLGKPLQLYTERGRSITTVDMGVAEAREELEQLNKEIDKKTLEIDSPEQAVPVETKRPVISTSRRGFLKGLGALAGASVSDVSLTSTRVAPFVRTKSGKRMRDIVNVIMRPEAWNEHLFLEDVLRGLIPDEVIDDLTALDAEYAAALKNADENERARVVRALAKFGGREHSVINSMKFDILKAILPEGEKSIGKPTEEYRKIKRAIRDGASDQEIGKLIDDFVNTMSEEVVRSFDRRVALRGMRTRAYQMQRFLEQRTRYGNTSEINEESARRFADIYMSTEERYARAERMGFNTKTPFYHGTMKTFSEFKEEFIGYNMDYDDEGFFFTSDAKDGSHWANSDPDHPGWIAATAEQKESILGAIAGSQVVPVFLKMKKPLTKSELKKTIPTKFHYGMDVAEHAADIYDDEDVKAHILARVKAKEFDSVHLVASDTAPDVAVVFSSNQIRSIHAAFDEDRINEPNILAAAPNNRSANWRLYASKLAEFAAENHDGNHLAKLVDWLKKNNEPVPERANAISSLISQQRNKAKTLYDRLRKEGVSQTSAIDNVATRMGVEPDVAAYLIEHSARTNQQGRRATKTLKDYIEEVSKQIDPETLQPNSALKVWEIISTMRIDGDRPFMNVSRETIRTTQKRLRDQGRLPRAEIIAAAPEGAPPEVDEIGFVSALERAWNRLKSTQLPAQATVREWSQRLAKAKVKVVPKAEEIAHVFKDLPPDSKLTREAVEYLVRSRRFRFRQIRETGIAGHSSMMYKPPATAEKHTAATRRLPMNEGEVANTTDLLYPQDVPGGTYRGSHRWYSTGEEGVYVNVIHEPRVVVVNGEQKRTVFVGQIQSDISQDLRGKQKKERSDAQIRAAQAFSDAKENLRTAFNPDKEGVRTIRRLIDSVYDMKSLKGITLSEFEEIVISRNLEEEVFTLPEYKKFKETAEAVADLYADGEFVPYFVQNHPPSDAPMATTDQFTRIGLSVAMNEVARTGADGLTLPMAETVDYIQGNDNNPGRAKFYTETVKNMAAKLAKTYGSTGEVIETVIEHPEKGDLIMDEPTKELIGWIRMYNSDVSGLLGEKPTLKSIKAAAAFMSKKIRRDELLGYTSEEVDIQIQQDLRDLVDKGRYSITTAQAKVFFIPINEQARANMLAEGFTMFAKAHSTGSKKTRGYSPKGGSYGAARSVGSPTGTLPHMPGYADDVEYVRKELAKMPTQVILGERVQKKTRLVKKNALSTVGGVLDWADKQGEAVLRAIWTKVGKGMPFFEKMIRGFSPMNDIVDLPSLLMLRSLAQGRRGSAQDIAERLANAVKKGTADDHENMRSYLTTADPALENTFLSMLSSDELRATAREVKGVIDEIGQQLVQQKFIHPDQYKRWRGQYLRRMYMAYFDSYRIPAGIRTSGITYNRGRKSIPSGTAIGMGQITDLPFLVYMSIELPLADMATMNYLNGIAEFSKTTAGNDWVLPESTVWYGGSIVTLFTLSKSLDFVKAEINRKEAERARVSAKDVIAKNRITREIAELTKQASDMEIRIKRNPDYARILVEKELPEGYAQLPDEPRKYGDMAGAIVRKSIFNDIMGSSGFMLNQQEDWFTDNARNALGEYNRTIKFLYTVANPPTHLRNFYSNILMLMQSGTNASRILDAFAAIAQHYAFGKPHPAVLAAQKFGSLKQTFTEQEIRVYDQFSRELRQREERAKRRKTFRGPLRGIHEAMVISTMVKELLTKYYADPMSFMYQWGDAVFKIAKIIDETERGMPEGVAAMEAADWFFDYSKVPPFVRFLRNSGAAPFISFLYFSIGATVKTSAEAPWRLAARFNVGLLAAALFMSHVLGMGADGDGDGDKDFLATYFLSLQNLFAGKGFIDEDAKKGLSRGLQKRIMLLPAPIRDEHGRLQWVDFGSIDPANGTFSAMASAAQGDIDGVAQSLALTGGPLFALGAMWTTGIDPFTGVQYFEKDDPEWKKASARTQYAIKAQMPPMMGYYMPPVTDTLGGPGYEALFGTGLDRSGEPTQTKAQLAYRAAGLSVYPSNYNYAIEKRIRAFDYDIKEVQRNINKLGNDFQYLDKNGNLNAQGRRRLAALERELKELNERKTQYQADTAVISALEAERAIARERRRK